MDSTFTKREIYPRDVTRLLPITIPIKYVNRTLLLLNFLHIIFYVHLQIDHGAPDGEIRHVGDLGNIVANSEGVAATKFSDGVVSLTGNRSIIGRGIIVHENVDDLGVGGHPDSKKTGNAGPRFACGVIGIL